MIGFVVGFVVGGKERAMRRLTTSLTADEFGRAALNLGRADENAAVRVEIDLSAILAQEPSASAHLTVESPVGAKYPARSRSAGRGPSPRRRCPRPIRPRSAFLRP